MIYFLGGLLVGFILGELNANRDESSAPTTQDIIVGWKNGK